MNGTATASSDGLQGQRFFSIVSNLRQDATDMLKRELDLLKAEVGEKVSCMGRQGVFIAIGAGVALFGVMLLLIGICGFIAFGLVKAGLSPLIAAAIAFAGFGAILGAVGYGVLNKGIKTLSKTKMAPEQTVRTVKEIAKPQANPILAHAGHESEEDSEKTRRVKVARAAAERKIQDVQREAAEIRARLNPRYMWAATRTAAKRRPQLSAGIGASILALGYLLIRRRRHSHI